MDFLSEILIKHLQILSIKEISGPNMGQQIDLIVVNQDAFFHIDLNIFCV